MAAEITKDFPDAVLTMTPSGGGRFEVSCNGVAIFEKSKSKRHAAPGEIIRLLERCADK